MASIHKITSDGLTIVAETRGNGPAIVFAHGLTGNREGVFEQFAPLLADHTIISFDQRGHGDSTPITDPKLYNAESMAEDMATVMEYFGVDKAVVGGESMGAATALLFALQYPEKVTNLLLTAPAFGDGVNADIDHIREMGDSIERLGIEGYIAESRKDILSNGLPVELADTMERRLRSHDRMSIATACKAVIQWQLFENLSVLAAFRAPTCIVAWKNDQLHPYDLAVRMTEIMPSAELFEYDLGLLFKEPESTGRIYRSFLSGSRPRVSTSPSSTQDERL